jgi:hypothetical protein
MATFGTFVDGVSLKAAEFNQLLVSVSSTPVIRQSNLVSTNTSLTQGKYFLVNKLVIYNFRWVSGVSGTGTASNRIELDLPVAAASNSMRVIGSGYYIDQSESPSAFRMAIIQFSTTRAAFLSETTTSLATNIGQTNGPAVTIAPTDSFVGTIMYEAA